MNFYLTFVILNKGTSQLSLLEFMWVKRDFLVGPQIVMISQIRLEKLILFFNLPGGGAIWVLCHIVPLPQFSYTHLFVFISPVALLNVLDQNYQAHVCLFAFSFFPAPFG